MKNTLSIRDFLLALMIVAIWGTNFVVIKEALGQLPPFLFATLRFALVFIPAAFFLKKPNLPWKYLANYGILIGVGQFGVLYFAMKQFIAPGLASLVMQTQVFFTIGLAMFIRKDKLQPFQWVALILATMGIGIIITHTDGHSTPLGICIALCAAMSWACGNIINQAAFKKEPSLNMLAFVVWSSVFAVPILLILSLVFEGPTLMTQTLNQMTWGAWLAVFWQSAANSIFGYAAWGWLLSRYPTSTIAPMSLLVPVFGMGSALIYFNETLPVWKLIAAALIMIGLALNILIPKLLERKKGL